jgi:hypothetical protein
MFVSSLYQCCNKTVVAVCQGTSMESKTLQHQKWKLVPHVCPVETAKNLIETVKVGISGKFEIQAIEILEQDM